MPTKKATATETTVSISLPSTTGTETTATSLSSSSSSFVPSSSSSSASSSSSSSSSSATPTETTLTGSTGMNTGTTLVSANAVRGKPTSGRVWKVVQKKRFSAMTRPSTTKQTKGQAYKVHMLQKSQHKIAQEAHKRLRDEVQAEKEAIKEKREEKRRRKAENEMKSATMQVINPDKLKRMNKKQLRMVKRTRVNANSGNVELVNAYQ